MWSFTTEDNWPLAVEVLPCNLVTPPGEVEARCPSLPCVKGALENPLFVVSVPLLEGPSLV